MRHVVPVVGASAAVAWFEFVGLALPYLLPDPFAVTSEGWRSTSARWAWH
ncbi:hypothetical protein [Streptomyces sp. NP160]|nr:hypothetical protein [Streptomyces sp. NP160]